MRATRLALPLVLAGLLASCTFTFLPLIPDKLAVEQRVVVTAASTLGRQDDEIVLTVGLAQVPAEGYLSAFLYRDDVKVGEDSRLIEPGAESVQFRFSGAAVGEYRAVLFWGGETLRHLEFQLR